MKKRERIGLLLQAGAVILACCLLFVIAGDSGYTREYFSTKNVKNSGYVHIRKEQVMYMVQAVKSPYMVIDEITDSVETVCFGTDKSLEESVENQLETAVSSVQDAGYDVSYILMNLETKEGVARGASDIYYSASAIKGPYICAVNCKRPEEAQNYLPIMELAITYSSNEDYELCRYIFGGEPMIEYMADAGVSSFEGSSEYVDLSAKDLAKLWIRNYEYLFSDEANAEWTRSIFESSLNSYIAEALNSESVTVYSKAGWIDSPYDVGVVYNDAGIVISEEDDPYLIVVMSSAYGEKEMLEDLVTALATVQRDLASR